MSQYKRLTDKKVKGVTERFIRVDKDYILSAYDIVDEENIVEMIINRLAELEDKIENGTLIELPCKVGDTVYEVFKEHGSLFIQETKIEKIVIVGEKGLRLKLARNSFYETAMSSLGKTVFLTRAEAEAKLRELQEGTRNEK